MAPTSKFEDQSRKKSPPPRRHEDPAPGASTSSSTQPAAQDVFRSPSRDAGLPQYSGSSRRGGRRPGNSRGPWPNPRGHFSPPRAAPTAPRATNPASSSWRNEERSTRRYMGPTAAILPPVAPGWTELERTVTVTSTTPSPAQTSAQPSISPATPERLGGFRYPWQDPESAMYLRPNWPWNFATEICPRWQKGCKKKHCSAAHSQAILQAHMERVKLHPIEPADRDVLLPLEGSRDLDVANIHAPVSVRELLDRKSEPGFEWVDAMSHPGQAILALDGIHLDGSAVVNTPGVACHALSVPLKPFVPKLEPAEEATVSFPLARDNSADGLFGEGQADTAASGVGGLASALAESIRESNAEMWEFHSMVRALNAEAQSRQPDPTRTVKLDELNAYNPEDVFEPTEVHSRTIKMPRPPAQIGETLRLATIRKTFEQPFLDQAWTGSSASSDLTSAA